MTSGFDISVQSLTKRFGAFTAVDRVSFSVRQGEIFGYLGANGAGKTTTIRMLCGLLGPTEGEALVAGVDIKKSPGGVKAAIGYMSQKFSLYQDLTVLENLQFFSGAYGLKGARKRIRISEALALSGLTGESGRLTRGLPGGMRQRLALASALLHQPRVLFLDEPTAGVDPASRRSFWRVIRRLAAEGTTLFVTTHHLDEAEYCGRVGLMVDGRLVALDTPEALKATHVPGTLHSVTGPSARRLAEALHGEPGVLGVKPFGLSTHVRVGPELAAPEAFAALLCACGLGSAEGISNEGALPEGISNGRALPGETLGSEGEEAEHQPAPATFRLEPAAVTLEDVFLELVERESRSGAGGDA